MKTNIKILHLEDNASDAMLVEALLESGGISCAITQVQTRDQFVEAIRKERFDLVLSDFSLPSFDGLSALTVARRECPDVPFIFVSGTIGEEIAIESLKRGATDYVLKDRLGRLTASVERAVVEAETQARRREMEERLRQQTELLNQIVQNVDDLVTVLDLNGNRLFVSRSSQLILPHRPSILGTCLFEDVHPADRDAVREAVRRAVESGAGQRTVYRLSLEAGLIRSVESQFSVIMAEDRGASWVIEVARDITERRIAENRVKEAEKRFRTLVESSVVGIMMVEDDRVIYGNPKLAEMLALEANEILGRALSEIVHPEDQMLARDQIEKCLSKSVRSHHASFRLTGSDGRVVLVESHGSLIDFNGRPAFIATLLDVTKRREDELRIREQAALLDRAHDAICVADMDLWIIYWNNGAERLYGLSREEVIGRNIKDVLFRESEMDLTLAVKTLISKSEWHGKANQVGKDGRNLFVDSRWSLMRDDAGKPKAILLINTDVTEVKEMEEQLLRAQRMENIGTLAGGIAHDLNNVLTPILLVSEMLREQMPDEASRRMLETARASAARGSEMVRQILSFARGLGGGHTPLHVKHLISEMTTLARETFPRSMRFQSRVAPDLSLVMGAATQLHQVLLNLCVNARDSMPDGGVIRIEAENVVLNEKRAVMFDQQFTGKFVRVRVSDSGTGISPELMDTIFQPFFTTKGEGRGTGLGLSTVMSIVKSHEGFLEVSSELGKGTTFSVYLPATFSGEKALAEGGVRTPPSGRGETILLVDDELALREITKETLEAFNYRVLTAADGVEAVTMYRRHHDDIRLVVTDLMMPVMDGPALIRALKHLNPEVLVVVVSGLDSQSRFSVIDRSSVQGFLNKPYPTEELLTQIRELLDNKPEHAPIGE